MSLEPAPHQTEPAQVPAPRGRSRHVVLLALTLGLLTALLALVLGQPPEPADIDLSLEAEQLNDLAPAAGPQDPSSVGTDSFANPGRSISPVNLGPAPMLEPPAPGPR